MLDNQYKICWSIDLKRQYTTQTTVNFNETSIEMKTFKNLLKSAGGTVGPSKELHCRSQSKMGFCCYLELLTGGKRYQNLL